MNYEPVKQAFADWVEEHGDKFGTQPFKMMEMDELQQFDMGGRDAWLIETCFCVDGVSLRESGAVVDLFCHHLSENGPPLAGYFMNSAALRDFHYTIEENEPSLVLTVTSVYVGD